jgi:hypothetical protein
MSKVKNMDFKIRREQKWFREDTMKKGMLRLMICCLGLVMVTSVSCASKRATEAAAKAQQEKVEALAQKKVEEKEAAKRNVPSVSVNVVQVNKRNKMQHPPLTAKGAADEVDVSAAPVEQQEKMAPRQKNQEPAKEKSVTRVAEVKRVPTRYNVYQYMPDTSKSLGTETLLSEISKEVAGKVYYELKDEGEKNFTAKVAVVNAVPLADLKRETEFGRILGEYILTDLADRGLQVTELRLGREINILPQTGEFIMSRNIGELANNAPELDYVVVSTFTNTRKTLIVQGRLVRLKDGLVKSTWRYGLPLNRELLGLFHTVEAPFKIAVKGMGQ